MSCGAPQSLPLSLGSVAGTSASWIVGNVPARARDAAAVAALAVVVGGCDTALHTRAKRRRLGMLGAEL
jgi:hypothetical protein